MSNKILKSSSLNICSIDLLSKNNLAWKLHFSKLNTQVYFKFLGSAGRPPNYRLIFITQI